MAAAALALLAWLIPAHPASSHHSCIANSDPHSTFEGSSGFLTVTTSTNCSSLLVDVNNDGAYETTATFGGQVGGLRFWQFPINTSADDGPGNRTINLSASGGGDTDTKSMNLSILNAAPTATFNAPTEVALGSSFTLSLTGPVDYSDADRAAGFTYSFDCGDGSGFGAFTATSSTTCSAASAGSRTVGGRIKDKDGGTSTYTGTVTVTAPPTAPAPTPGAPAADTTPPIVSAAALSRRVFRAASRGPAVLATVGVGTKITYTLSEPATVRLRVGRRKAGRYVAMRGRLRHAGQAGANRVKFTGRLRGRKLRRGRYRLTVVAVDAAGNKSPTRRLKFRIVG